MKMKLLFVLCGIIINSLLGACADMNDNIDKYLSRGEIVNIAKSDSISAFAGKERFYVKYWQTDPRATEMRIYWSQEKAPVCVSIPEERDTSDSLVVWVGKEQGIKEGSYSLSIVTFDKFGNKSVPDEQNVNVYGDKFAASIIPRILLSREFNPAQNTLRLVWGGSVSAKEWGVRLFYTKIDGAPCQILYKSADLPENLELKDIDVMSSVEYETLYLPEVTAVDTFYTERVVIGESFGDQFYVDATSGSDDNSGLSANQPWKTLKKAGERMYQPGDKLLLKRGEVFEGSLEFTGEGRSDKPIFIDAYGNGSKPHIKGVGNKYAVHVYNSSYVTIQNLEITNYSEAPVTGEHSGIKVECNEYGESKGIKLNNLYIHDVNGQMVKGNGRGCGCGIFLWNGGTSTKSRFVDMIIENCHLKNCTRDGIIWAGGRYINHEKNWYPNLNTIVRNNLLEEIAGDAIVPVGCDGTLIEYNVVRDWLGTLKETASAGIWPWSSDNTTIQFNDVSGFLSDSDGQAFDADYNCKNTVIQYNYSHDNEGGFVLLCDDSSQDYSVGMLDAKIRYNVSINDGHRKTTQREPSPAIQFNGPSANAYLERNIIHVIDRPRDEYRLMVRMSAWREFTVNPTFKENVFYTSEESEFMISDQDFTFAGNWYLGDRDFDWTIAVKATPGKGTPTGKKTNYYDQDARFISSVYQTKVLNVDATGYKPLQELLMKKRIVGGKEHYFIEKGKIEAFFAEMKSEN